MLFPLTERYCIESRNGYRIACHKSAGLRVARTDIRPEFLQTTHRVYYTHTCGDGVQPYLEQVQPPLAVVLKVCLTRGMVGERDTHDDI